jgi:site-specific DNA-methyltransferase (adenine-specific)
VSWKLTLGDCLEGLAALEDKSVDHSFLDPPYEAEAHSKGRRILTGSAAAAKSNTRDIIEKQISYPPITEAERLEVSKQVARITRRWILVFCQAEAIHLWRIALEAGGAEYKRAGVYWKEDAQPQYNGQMPGVGWEAIVIAHGMPRKGPTRWNAGGKCARWDSAADARFGKKLDVDGQKPEHLIDQLIRDFTDSGELICVPYGGAGTEIACAIKLGRRVIAWEKIKKHYEIARKRAENAKVQLALPSITEGMKQGVLL